jgi:hypothetical protein
MGRTAAAREARANGGTCTEVYDAVRLASVDYACESPTPLPAPLEHLCARCDVPVPRHR